MGTEIGGLLALAWTRFLPKCAEAIILLRMPLPAPVALCQHLRQGAGESASGAVPCANSAGAVSCHARVMVHATRSILQNMESGASWRTFVHLPGVS